jgi:tRNA(Ile)-lysidine synthase
LFFSREEIANYANENDIKWREDSSISDKLRNKIRHDLVPLQRVKSYFILVSKHNHLQESQAMVEDAYIMVYQQVARQEEEGIYFDLNQLRKLPNYNLFIPVVA